MPKLPFCDLRSINFLHSAMISNSVGGVSQLMASSIDTKSAVFVAVISLQFVLSSAVVSANYGSYCKKITNFIELW